MTATMPSSAEDFLGAPGSVVEVRDEQWLITGVERDGDGWLVDVQGLTELVRDTTATFATVLDEVKVVDPADATVVADDSSGYRRTRLWLEAMLRKSPVPLTDPNLTVATQGLADALGYQQAAVRKALDPENLRPRILLADAVGLGKTLEIAMILAELVRRGRGERILVVTPRHVLEQMQFELWTRFALPFVRLDSVGIQRIRQQLPANRNPFMFYKRVIISIDTLKSDRYLAHLQKQRWDAVVIDESHNVTNSTSQNNRLAKLLASRTDALVLASATPHNGKAASFAELVRMLDPSAVRPDGSLIEDEVKRLVIRRHRHSPDVASVVGGDWAERKEPQNLLVSPSPAESDIIQELEDTWLYPATGSSPYSGANGGLFPWTLAKAFLSSPAALRESVRERIRRLEPPRKGGQPARPAPTPEQRREIEALQILDDLAAAAGTKTSAKYAALVDYLQKIGVGARKPMRAVVFAERVATLRWLQESLCSDLGLSKEQVAVLHGGLSDVDQQAVVESFKQASSHIRVLVTGDVASEGVNLHAQCHELIHFDIPWSLIRIEQRNGRIDRYGQKQQPQITTLLLDPDSGKFAGDVRVLKKLVEKEYEAHKALGDSASLMGKYDVEAEEDAIRRVLAEGRDLDDEVKTVEEVKASPGVAGLFARLTAAKPTEAATTAPTAGGSVGVFATELDFFREAVEEFLPTPGAAPPNGVSWKEHPEYSIVEFVPPPDLRQRLEVLPQSYLAARRVAQKMRLASTPQRGKAELTQALSDESSSLWPEAHYLAPLHPVVEWASDRALASLGRNQVFAVRGDVEELTVVLHGSLTNVRGQVVAASFLLATFPNPANPSFAPVTPFASAAAALAEAGFTGVTVNAGGLVGADLLTRYVGPAVRAADRLMGDVVQAAESATRDRVQRWSERTNKWDDEAGVLVQRSELRDRRQRVEEEREMAKSMLPERRLVRPLLVVVPREADVRAMVGGN
ncbi:SNF2 family N-terminal domain-containing protein [Blastococcus aggregatus]|uniref:SNF2 family N-terminal domain-containing protein n=1 Tax=Blastococcus aggregatus TaxID=38502 RepID=A0A285VCQ6_9ACTN|nr:helicase-related protein [Blastococcus aggregatus]SOC50281.1 SNF2 family N-terminal domain-containing protein [Blastococcus aggregatus]